MAADSQRIQGLDDLLAKLREMPKKLRTRVLLGALRAAARPVRKEARQLAPVLKEPHPYRKPGTVRNAISIRTSRVARRAGDTGVFVNVRPARKGVDKNGVRYRGAQSNRDPYYWQWLEFGRKARSRQRTRRAVTAIAPMRFLQRAADKLGESLKTFTQQVGKWFDKVSKTGKVE